MGFTVASNHDLSELSRKARKTKLPTRPMTQANPPLQFFGRFKRLEKPRWVSRLLTTPATLRPFQRSLQRAIVFLASAKKRWPVLPESPRGIFSMPA